ncbi:MAG: GTPase HflX [Myxococcota bacterium]|nr:GTPase HflX [Myxococcota bacterium]
MSCISTVTGNLTGLKPNHKRTLERLYKRRVAHNRIITPELARHLASISREIGRQVGVLVNRRGQVESVFVGDAHRIYLPDLGRQRAGQSSLRGVRHIHTVMGKAELHRDDLTDLTKLRLDMVCALAVTEEGRPEGLTFAHLNPRIKKATKTAERVTQDSYRSIHDCDVDFEFLIDEIERELGRQTRSRTAGTQKTRAMLVGVYAKRETATWRMDELRELAATAGVAIENTIIQVRPRADSRFVVGSGKLEEIVLQCLDLDIELIIFDHNLSPAQARAIAASSDLKVIDRTQLILDIFAQHAQSRDGKLQVELAQLKYNLPRLTDLDAGLSRLTGGIGGRGPGETKLEINRRRARERITKLETEIEGLSKQRLLRRSRRQSSGIPIVSVVGYTNAGKSTLLNVLTSSEVLVADQLFATLDPTSRRLRFPREREAVITDTVGFIRDLPPDLIRAFRATLEELENADLLLHVVDISDPMRDAKIEAVRELLKELQINGIPEVLVFNKADLVEPFVAQALGRKHQAVPVSATGREGISELIECICENLWREQRIEDRESWLGDDFGEIQESEPHVAETPPDSPRDTTARKAYL